MATQEQIEKMERKLAELEQRAACQKRGEVSLECVLKAGRERLRYMQNQSMTPEQALQVINEEIRQWAKGINKESKEGEQ